MCVLCTAPVASVWWLQTCRLVKTDVITCADVAAGSHWRGAAGHSAIQRHNLVQHQVPIKHCAAVQMMHSHDCASSDVHTVLPLCAGMVGRQQQTRRSMRQRGLLQFTMPSPAAFRRHVRQIECLCILLACTLLTCHTVPTRCMVFAVVLPCSTALPGGDQHVRHIISHTLVHRAMPRWWVSEACG